MVPQERPEEAMKTQKFATLMIVLALTLSAPFAVADDSTQMHNPYTVLGVQLRAALIADASDGSSAVTVGPAVFQEIIPCRLVSTLEADHYSPQWGMPTFAPNESRSYRSTGELIDGVWTNPCSKQIPENSLAVAARVWAVGPKSSDSAVLWVTPGNGVTPDNLSKIVLREGEKTAAEATFVLRNHMFTMTSQLGSADIVVDIIGYFLPDPWGRGDKGDKGDAGATGPQGAKGDAGSQGIQGEKGDNGAAGAQGLKGDKGENGAAGATGPQGAKGDAGSQGIQGEKGERGETGAQGLKGDAGAQGLKGDTGAQGLKGDTGAQGSKGETGAQGIQGEKGERGEAGAQGLKGDAGAQGLKGDTGAQGLKGDTGAQGSKGDTGAQGLKGDRGDQGFTGPMGPQGPEGPQGIPGTPGGPYVSSLNCMAQGENSVTLSNSNVHVNSAIMVTVTGRSLGNIISVLAQGEGWLTVSGKPATCFRYVVFN
jgi:hypothetical protein